MQQYQHGNDCRRKEKRQRWLRINCLENIRPQETGTARRLNDTKQRAPQFVLLSQRYELTPRGLGAIERAISSRGVKNFPHFMEHVTSSPCAQKSTTCHLSQTWDTLIQATPCHFISLRSLPTLFSHLQLLLTGILSVICGPNYLSLTGVSAKLPETSSGIAGCEVRTVLTVLCIMYGTVPTTDIHTYCRVQNR